MVRVVRFHQHGGPEVLRIENIDVPPPAPGEVQIRVRALGLNRAEVLLRSGSYIETPTLPSGLGLEAAGIARRHELVDVDAPDVLELLAQHELRVESMGRAAADDRALFQAAAAAGALAASHVDG